MKGVERLKGTAKGIDLASFIAEYRNWPKNMLFLQSLIVLRFFNVFYFLTSFNKMVKKSDPKKLRHVCHESCGEAGFRA